MAVHRINIIGASGSGKTTLARALAEKLQIPHFDSDHFFHFPTDPPFQKQRSPQERYEIVMQTMGEHRSWTLSGAVANWEPPPPLDYSLVVLLYLPPDLRLDRLKTREQQLYGARIAKGGDMEADHEFFMSWTAGYDAGTAEGSNTLPHHESILKRVKCPTLRLDTPMDTAALVQTVMECLL